MEYACNNSVDAWQALSNIQAKIHLAFSSYLSLEHSYSLTKTCMILDAVS